MPRAQTYVVLCVKCPVSNVSHVQCPVSGVLCQVFHVPCPVSTCPFISLMTQGRCSSREKNIKPNRCWKHTTNIFDFFRIFLKTFFTNTVHSFIKSNQSKTSLLRSRHRTRDMKHLTQNTGNGTLDMENIGHRTRDKGHLTQSTTYVWALGTSPQSYARLIEFFTRVHLFF